jgi:hypothetical protein
MWPCAEYDGFSLNVQQEVVDLSVLVQRPVFKKLVSVSYIAGVNWASRVRITSVQHTEWQSLATLGPTVFRQTACHIRSPHLCAVSCRTKPFRRCYVLPASVPPTSSLQTQYQFTDRTASRGGCSNAPCVFIQASNSDFMIFPMPRRSGDLSLVGSPGNCME